MYIYLISLSFKGEVRVREIYMELALDVWFLKSEKYCLGRLFREIIYLESSYGLRKEYWVLLIIKGYRGGKKLIKKIKKKIK